MFKTCDIPVGFKHIGIQPLALLLIDKLAKPVIMKPQRKSFTKSIMCVLTSTSLVLESLSESNCVGCPGATLLPLREMLGTLLIKELIFLRVALPDSELRMAVSGERVLNFESKQEVNKSPITMK